MNFKDRKKLILNFGMPRTGTTFVEQMLNQTDQFHDKITEGASAHTVTGTGIYDIVSTFARRHVVLIRTWREHEESFASMEDALNKGRFPNFSLDRMRQWAEREVENWKNVIEQVSDQPRFKVTFIELNLDHIERYEIERIPGINDEALKFFDENYGSRPVRIGRLQEGKHQLQNKDVIRALPHPRVLDSGYYHKDKE